MKQIQDFTTAMYKYVPEDARIVFCQFRGDPGDDQRGKWRARVLRRDSENLDLWANIYFCVSAMKENMRGEFRRRKENFSGGLLLMIDDVGDGEGSKFPLSTIDALEPTALIETSAGNFQAIYMFKSLVDEVPFNQLINAFIRKKFLGTDTGMAGVNRVFRPPAGKNGKEKHNGWEVQLAAWAPERRYSIDEIADAFGLSLKPAGRSIPPIITDIAAQVNIEEFNIAKSELKAADLLKANRPDMAGWTEITCPWVEEHGGARDNGTGITEPNPNNNYFGGYKCFHDSCKTRRWRDLARWIDEESWDVMAMRLNRINEEAM